MIEIVKMDELYHHGILGQRWGVRRTPEQLGHKRSEKQIAKARLKAIKVNSKYAVRNAKDEAKNRAKIEKAQQKAANKLAKYKKPEKTEEEKSVKSVKDMSDDEIRSKINRIKLENEYRSYTNPPKKDSFAKKFFNDAVKPAVTNAGRDFIEKSLKKAIKEIMGEETTSVYDEIKRDAEHAKNKANLAKNELEEYRYKKQLSDLKEKEEEKKKKKKEKEKEKDKDKDKDNNPNN